MPRVVLGFRLVLGLCFRPCFRPRFGLDRRSLRLRLALNLRLRFGLNLRFDLVRLGPRFDLRFSLHPLWRIGRHRLGLRLRPGGCFDRRDPTLARVGRAVFLLLLGRGLLLDLLQVHLLARFDGGATARPLAAEPLADGLLEPGADHGKVLLRDRLLQAFRDALLHDDLGIKAQLTRQLVQLLRSQSMLLRPTLKPNRSDPIPPAQITSPQRHKIHKVRSNSSLLCALRVFVVIPLTAPRPESHPPPLPQPRQQPHPPARPWPAHRPRAASPPLPPPREPCVPSLPCPSAAAPRPPWP